MLLPPALAFIEPPFPLVQAAFSLVGLGFTPPHGSFQDNAMFAGFCLQAFQAVLALVGLAFPLVGNPLALVCLAFPLVRNPLALVCLAVSVVGADPTLPVLPGNWILETPTSSFSAFMCRR